VYTLVVEVDGERTIEVPFGVVLEP
jgi:hypothetical protein